MNEFDLKGRVAIVTGGAKGIGYAAARRLVGSGAAVSLWDLDAEGMATAARALAPKGAVQQVRGPGPCGQTPEQGCRQPDQWAAHAGRFRGG